MENKKSKYLEETIYGGVIALSFLTINKNIEEEYFLSNLVYFLFKLNVLKQSIIIIGIIILANLTKAKTKKVLQLVALVSVCFGIYNALMAL